MKKDQILGFGTGCLYKNIEPVSEMAINLIEKTGCNAIELCAVMPERMNFLENIEKTRLSSFQYVSLHAPDIIYDENPETQAILQKIEKAQKKFSFNHIVICPNLVKDWTVFDSLNFPISFENMDVKKKFGTTIEDMKKVTDRGFKIVLDLTHIFTIDKTMTLAKEFYKQFNENIVAIHASGYQIHGKDEQQHYPLFKSRQREISQSLNSKIPTIIESVWPETKTHILQDDLREEYKYFQAATK